MILRRVDRIGLRILDTEAQTVTLRNRTNHTTFKLDAVGVERWRKYLMAYGRGGYGRSKKRGTSVRLTGLFRSKKKRGLAVGSMTELDDVKALLKRAINEEQGLVFFLWRNEPDEDADKKQPDYTLYADVNQDQDSDRPRKRREIEDDDAPAPKKSKKKPVEDDDEPESKDDDDEVPF